MLSRAFSTAVTFTIAMIRRCRLMVSQIVRMRSMPELRGGRQRTDWQRRAGIFRTTSEPGAGACRLPVSLQEQALARTLPSSRDPFFAPDPLASLNGEHLFETYLSIYLSCCCRLSRSTYSSLALFASRVFPSRRAFGGLPEDPQAPAPAGSRGAHGRSLALALFASVLFLHLWREPEGRLFRS